MKMKDTERALNNLSCLTQRQPPSFAFKTLNSFCTSNLLNPYFSLRSEKSHSFQIRFIEKGTNKGDKQPISKYSSELCSSSLNLIIMSAIEMSLAPKFSYQRLRNEGGLDDDYEDRGRVVIGRTRSWSRVRKVPIRKRFRLRIPGLRRFLRRKARLVSAVRVSWGKVMKRLKESQSHFGDLFAGNYMFLQVNPTQFKCIEKSFKGHHDFHGLSSRYSLDKVA